MATILLVNPDSVQGWLYQQELQLQGHTVHVATTGAQAISLLKAVRANLIILDSGPPGSTGAHRLARRLRQLAALPVILNATSFAFDAEQCRRYGWEPAATVLKSSDLGPLVCAIDRVLEGSAPRQGATT